MTAATPTLPGDLDLGLRRLRLGAMRRLAPELLVTAKTQRWAPEEFLRTLIETEIASRDASNARGRMKQAAFPVTKSLDEFNVAASSVKPATFDYLACLEWIAADRRQGECLSRRPRRHRQRPSPRRARPRRGPRRSPGPILHRRRSRRNALPGPRRQLRRPGHREHPQGRPHPDRRDRIRSPRRQRRPTPVPPRRRRLRTTLTRQRIPLALRRLGPLPPRAHHRRQPPRSATPSLSDRRHRRRVIPHERSPRQERTNQAHNQVKTRRGAGTSHGHRRGLQPGH